MWRVDVAALIKNRRLIGFPVVVRVGENQDAVPFGACPLVAAIVDDFAHPHTPQVVHVNVGRTHQHRLGGKQLGLQFRVHVQSCHGLVWIKSFVWLRFIRRQATDKQNRNEKGRHQTVQAHRVLLD